ncbi:MAG: bifunctional phosphoribosylaminoimidazolecarboxamide formyltransferase/IMP cyclohydrolase [Candidatus Thermoplasmatota archaeon]|nr:bifunctional phosphoribosylaminoimidazolecarboxamide formyltransferase/IMP cyclohydrolase [Candidatus Thermoplasmatota archaeon]
MNEIKRALISVSDKSSVVEFAKALQEAGVEILSTGGTAKVLEENGIKVTRVSDFTGYPEMLDGRVKTLHPKVHGAILARRDDPKHMQQLQEASIPTIDMVVVNLYPFEETIAKPDATFEDAIENIDIGGPSMLRSAAKNHKDVAVVVNPNDYSTVIEEIRTSGDLSPDTRWKLALEAFEHTSRYDTVISGYLRSRKDVLFPDTLGLQYEKVQELRYGENPNQKAAFYRDPSSKAVCVASSEKLHGKELSYNNILDADAALDILKEFERPTCSVIKHTNPCGVAVSDDIYDAFMKAYACDPKSAFGGIIGVNRTMTPEIASEISKYFVELVVAPEYDEEAFAILSKKKNVRIMATHAPIVKEDPVEMKYVKVKGGLLSQTGAFAELDPKDAKVVTKREPTEIEMKGLLFAWKIIRHIKSNSILLVQGEETVGVGAGQMSRVDASMLAGHKAGERAAGSQLASDAFFPFRDGVDEAAKVGATSIIQPGGSIRDQEVTDAANEHGMAMVFSGMRMFKH